MGAGGVIRGPAGGAVGVAGAPGAWGGAVSQLPAGYRNINWGGGNYWYNNGRWYNPYWYGDSVWYYPTYPPVGWYTPTVDWAPVEPVVIDNTTYYESDGVYYQKTTKDGQEGYAVVKAPEQTKVTGDANLPDPFELLKKGLAYMGAQKQFEMSTSDTYDEIASGNRKVSYQSWREMSVSRPGSMAINFQGDDQKRSTIFNAGKLTLIDFSKNSYGEATLPPTIDEALDKVASDYGVSVPAAELIRTDLYDKVAPRLQTGQNLGKDTVGGQMCDHLAFTTADTDLEVWLDSGPNPMVRKVSISYKTAPTRPRYTMTIAKFDVKPVADSAFQANIPAGAQLVSLKPAEKSEAK
jgi:hypothetical protein